MPEQQPPGEWSSGSDYEAYVGRWSRRAARTFIEWLDAGAGLRWLDVGCGTGALSATVVELADPAEVVGMDASSAYVDDARLRLADPRVRFEVGNAQSIATDTPFDVAVSGLVVNFLPDPLAAVTAMRRAVRPGGLVSAYVWDYAGRMDLMRHFWDAASTLDETARDLDEGVRFPLCNPRRLAALWDDAGLGSVETRAIDVRTVFNDFDDYWSPFLGAQGPAPRYLMSLPESQRAVLREAVRASLPIASDGSISLLARAWAVRGHT